MKIGLIFLWMLMILFVGPKSTSAERVILKNGYDLTGEVLKSDAKTVVVDLGITVLRLDRADIDRVAEVEAENTESKDQPREEKAAQWQLYHTAKLQHSSIEKNTERFGEAVVMVTSPGGQGSGFIITEDGYLITNYHVIAQETRIKVAVFHKTDKGYEQQHYKKVKIIALNPFVDLALLKIEEADRKFPYVYLGRMDQIEVGQTVFAIGNPLGLTRTVSQGIVSTKNRNFEGRLYIQTTADINPGNSGGPLFNLKGEVIGVTSMGYLYLGGLNFAIPTDVVKRFVINRDAFAYDEDNPNSGYRYLQPSGRKNKEKSPLHKLPTLESAQSVTQKK